MKRTFNSETSSATDNMASANVNKSAETKSSVHQTGVINRARTAIGDAWKQKPNTGSTKLSATTVSVKSTKTTNSPTATNKTMDFFTLWARHKKISDKTKLDETDENTEKSLKDKSKYNNVQGSDSSSANTSSIPIKIVSNRGDKEKNILVDNSNKHQNKKKVMDTTMSSSAHTAKSNIHTNNMRNIKEKRKRHCLSRNTSLDLALLAPENSTHFVSTQTLGQSYDDINVDYGQQVIVNQRRNTFGESDRKVAGSKTNEKQGVRQCNDDLMIGHKINDRENYVLENEEINEDSGQKGVIKARLRLAKINSRDESPVNIKPGILHRRGSTDSPTASRIQNNKKSKSEIAQSDTIKENQLLNVTRPRKKLSFKEPVECSKFLDLKSDTIPRATKFLEEYEEQRSGSLDIDLEVGVVLYWSHVLFELRNYFVA